MCTAISITHKDHYFGRNLDYEHSFNEQVTITPRNYEFSFRNGQRLREHFAIIGMALPMGGYPLYFDATNEKGLSVAGLNFPEFAKYNSKDREKTNLASFEFIPWILSRFENVAQAENGLKEINITDEKFSEGLLPTPLHWIISDKNKSITVEQTQKGLLAYDNPVGVLTNSPSFDMQIFNLRNFLGVTAGEPENMFSKKIELEPYSRGMGGIGLPGDLSSMSRFVRASFTKLNAVFGETEDEVIYQFFHILNSVYQQKGCAKVKDKYEITNYSSCCNTVRGIYYYTTYYNSGINAVDMHREDLNSSEIITFPIEDKGYIKEQN